MKSSAFRINDFFDTSEFPYLAIFENADFAWDSLKKTGIFIEEQFKNGKLNKNYQKDKNIFIGKGTRVEHGALIKGPAIIGENCVIEHGSFIRENCVIGNNVHVGHGTEVKNSIILNSASIAHLNYVGDSIIGNNVNISGGAIIANFRFDKRSVLIKIGSKKIDTGLNKFGAIVGDNSVIGVNSVLNPGTILGKNTAVYPLVSVRGVHKNNEIIKK